VAGVTGKLRTIIVGSGANGAETGGGGGGVRQSPASILPGARVVESIRVVNQK